MIHIIILPKYLIYINNLIILLKKWKVANRKQKGITKEGKCLFGAIITYFLGDERDHLIFGNITKQRQQRIISKLYFLNY